MAESSFGDYFVKDLDEEAIEEADAVAAPVVIPGVAPQQAAPQVAAQPGPAPVAQAPAMQPMQPSVAVGTRGDQLVRALNAFMTSSPDVQAAALVSLDGFIIASALPKGMQEDRVGAMSAAILGLGERAAAELGRGHLTQVFIEGADGYVLLISAGDRAVMTSLADKDAKLGLVLYDMKSTAGRIGEILR